MVQRGTWKAPSRVAWPARREVLGGCMCSPLAAQNLSFYRYLLAWICAASSSSGTCEHTAHSGGGAHEGDDGVAGDVLRGLSVVGTCA